MITNDLVKYISERLVTGISRDDLTNSLTREGWTKQDVDEAFSALENTKQSINSTITTNKTNPSSLHIHKLFIGVFVLLLVAGGYLFFNKTQPIAKESVVESAVSEDQFEALAYKPVPIEENAAHDFDSIASNITKEKPLFTREEADFIKKYVSKVVATNTPPLKETQIIVDKHKDILDIFDSAVKKKYFQCVSETGEICGLSIVRDAHQIALLKAYTLLLTGNRIGALEYGKKIIALGQHITAGSNNDIVPLLIGWVIQQNGYSFISIAGNTSYSQEEKSKLIGVLRQEHKLVFDFMKLRQFQIIDYITSPSNKPSLRPLDPMEEAAVQDYRTDANSLTWNPEETKKWFNDSYEIAKSNIDLGCSGGPYKESKIDLKFNPEDTSPENQNNYRGKMLYMVSYGGFDSVNLKRCQIEEAINNL